MIKKYLQFIKETKETNEDPEIESKFKELKDEIKSLIEETLKNTKGEFKSTERSDFSEFKDRFLKSPDDVKIEGLINDSDIYDFYLKFRNDIDELLNDINFFDEIPSEMNSFGLYEYIIKGTQKAVIEITKTLSGKYD